MKMTHARTGPLDAATTMQVGMPLKSTLMPMALTGTARDSYPA